MTHLKKRMRRMDATKEESESSSLTAAFVSSSLAAVDERAEGLLQQVETLVSPDANSMAPLQMTLLSLKGMQRDLFHKLQESNDALQAKQASRQKQERSLASLQYERAHLEKEIENCKSFQIPHLQRLAQEEVQEKSDTTETTLSSEQLLNTFLKADVNDPSQRQVIVAQLHKELNARGGLERDLKLKQKEISLQKQKLAMKRKFLQSLPDHLDKMERASQPLQKFMASQSTGKTVRMIGSDRRTRLDLAKSLPAPLYTLFQQLQQYLDQSTDDNGISISITGGPDDSHKQVVLNIPVPDLANPMNASSSSRSNKRVVIHFHYLPNPGVVTAVASGCSTSLNQAVLLEELFPNDIPDTIQSKRPYHWCNYLAGLHLVNPSATDAQAASTRVIVKQLERRVRANATLKHILTLLQRSHILPKPPNREKVATKLDCRLIEFKEVPSDNDDNNNKLERTFKVLLRKDQENLMAKVRIHLSRYPAVPPQWTLDVSDDDENNDSLYEDRFAVLERRVNVELLDHVMQTDQEEAYFDWILAYQVRDIMEQFDALSQGETASAGSRTHRGRDRVPVKKDS